MKIDKTEGEFRDIIRCTLSPFTEEDPKERYASALIAALDLQFKQEEPELPQRVRMHHIKGLVVVIKDGPPATEIVRDLTIEEYREAAARYNASPGLLGIVRWAMEEASAVGHTNFEYFASDLLSAMERELDEQREKLSA